MSLGIICCRVLESEIRALIQDVKEVSHLEVMEWGLHIRPDQLVEAVSARILALQNRVSAIVLGYGRCQAMDRLPGDFKIPVFLPEGDDCIGVLLGQERYARALQEEPTWFLTPGWTEIGMEFIFHELQLNRMAAKGQNPLQLAHQLLEPFTRALFIDMKLDNGDRLLKKAREIAVEFNFRLEITEGSLTALKAALDRALEAASLKR